MLAQQSYLICATPRTGSTFLCEMLRGTKMMGDPQEYFELLKETGLPRQPTQYFIPCKELGWNTDRITELLGFPELRIDLQKVAEFHRQGYSEYVSRIVDNAKTDNGVFGAKVMWGHLGDLLGLRTGNCDLSSSTRVDDCLKSVFGNLTYIHVTRQDKLRQAISLWKAVQTQQWRLDLDTREPKKWRVPVFDFEAIDYLHRRLVEHDRAWQRLFADAHIEPLVLCYEEFASDPKRAFLQVAQFLGLQDAKRRFVPPMMIRQSNSQSEGWIERYRRISRSKWHKRTSVC